MAAYVNAVRAIVCFEFPAREASSFCDFLKLTSCDFITFISSLIEVNFCFLWVCLLRIKFPYLCLKLNHFDAVDFSECHSEEVISFFWRSVYIGSVIPKLVLTVNWLIKLSEGSSLFLVSLYSTGACIAKHMGLPIKIVCAVNSNDIIHRTFSQNDYSMGKMVHTLSPAIDIQVCLE